MDFIINILDGLKNPLNVLTLLLIFYLFFELYRNRKNVEVQGIFILWKTKLGIKLMDRLAKILKKNKTFLNLFIYLMFFYSFLAFIYIFYYLIEHTTKLINKETNTPGVSIIIPGVSEVAGLSIPFWTILVIFIVAIVHEFGHGLFARIFNLKVKSTGLAMLGPIPGAFVELDEKDLEKKRMKEKLSVLVAGPFFNILLGSLSFLLLTAPLFNENFEYKGIYYKSFLNNSLPQEGIIYEISGIKIDNVNTLINVLSNKSVGDTVLLKTDKGYFNTTLQNYSGKAMLGIHPYQKCDLSFNPLKCYLTQYLASFLLFLALFNIGIGTANLLPFLFLDGGKIAYFLLLGNRIIPQTIGKSLFLFFNLITLLLLLLNLLYPLYKPFL